MFGSLLPSVPFSSFLGHPAAGRPVQTRHLSVLSHTASRPASLGLASALWLGFFYANYSGEVNLSNLRT